MTVENDEFTGQTVVHFTSPVEWEDGRQQRAELSMIVDPATMVGGLSVTTSHDRWRWLECHPFNLLVDGERIPLAESDHDGRVGRGFVVEQVRVPLDRAAVVALTQASEVRFRVCRDVMRLSRASTTALQGMAPRIAENTPPMEESAGSEAADTADAD